MSTHRGWIPDLTIISASLLVLAGLASAFTLPWLEQSRPPSSDLERYLPLEHGDARLLKRFASTGELTSWQSEHVRSLPAISLFNELLYDPTAAILTSIAKEGEIIGDPRSTIRVTTDVLAVTRRELFANGEVGERTDLLLRDQRGLLLLGWERNHGQEQALFSPPALLLPRSLVAGPEWQTTGRMDGVPYEWSGRVEGPARHDLAHDCLSVLSTFKLGPNGQHTSRSRIVMCAEIGNVESVDLDEQGQVVDHWQLASWQDQALSGPQTLPGHAAETSSAALTEDWRLSRVGQLRIGTSSYTTMPPTWVPVGRPVVIGADQQGQLVALDAHDIGGPARWRFQLGGSTYGAPAVDRERGRLYVGSTDKRVTALDTRGLFLWSYPTRDHVVATPLISAELVIVVSEDHSVTALEADTGRPVWRYLASGPIVSTPTLVEETVIVGTDDQTLLGLDRATGALRWTSSTQGAVEAPLTSVDDRLVIVPSQAGVLSAIDPRVCEDSCELSWSVQLDGPLRTAATILGEHTYVVDEYGTLSAVRLSDGRREWWRSERFIGPAVASDRGLIVVTREGAIHRLAIDGSTLETWHLSDVAGPIDETPEVNLGAVSGGGAIWIATRRSVVHRLGPAPADPPIQEIPLRWTLKRSSLRGEDERFTLTPARLADGGLALLDSNRRIHRLNARTGQIEAITTLSSGGFISPIEPVVAANQLFAIVGNALTAAGLAPGASSWRLGAEGQTNRPPAVVDGRILWMSASEQPGGALLRAVDAQSGAELWRQELSPALTGGGAITRGTVVYGSSPPAAFDSQTGAELWRAPLAEIGLGGPALSPDGSRLLVGLLDPTSGAGSVAALDTRTGALVWRTSLAGEVLGVLESLWVHQGMVIVPTVQGHLMGLDETTGAIRWRFPSPRARMGTVTVARGMVWLLHEQGQITGVDVATGQQVARWNGMELNVGSASYMMRPAIDDQIAVVVMSNLVLGLELP